MLSFCICYLLGVPYLGYMLSIIGLMLGVALYIGARFGAKPAVIAGLGGLFFYLLFVQVLNVPLPAGIWPRLLGTLHGCTRGKGKVKAWRVSVPPCRQCLRHNGENVGKGRRVAVQ